MVKQSADNRKIESSILSLATRKHIIDIDIEKEILESSHIITCGNTINAVLFHSLFPIWEGECQFPDI